MATRPPYKPAPAPKVSERLWSTEVAQVESAEGLDPFKRDPVYRFNNGRSFAERAPYEAPDLPEEPLP